MTPRRDKALAVLPVMPDAAHGFEASIGDHMELDERHRPIGFFAMLARDEKLIKCQNCACYEAGLCHRFPPQCRDEEDELPWPTGRFVGQQGWCAEFVTTDAVLDER